MKQSYYGKRRAQGYDIGTDVSEIAGFYLVEWQRLGQPQPILEPMCGTGLNLEVFQKAGIRKYLIIANGCLKPMNCSRCCEGLDSKQ